MKPETDNRSSTTEEVAVPQTPSHQKTTSFGRVDVRCPLCQGVILSVSRGQMTSGRLSLHPLRTHRNPMAEGISVCDECAVLADPSPDVTLN